MLAGPFQSVDKMLMQQYQFTLDMTKNLFNLTTEEALDEYPGIAATQELAENVTEIANGQFTIAESAKDETFMAGASISFWESWIRLAEISHDNIVRAAQPILIVNGDMDSNVPVAEADYWSSYMDSLGQSGRVQTEIFRCLSHSFNCIAADDFSEQIPETSFAINVDPRVADTMASWIFEQAQEKVGALVYAPASGYRLSALVAVLSTVAAIAFSL